MTEAKTECSRAAALRPDRGVSTTLSIIRPSWEERQPRRCSARTQRDARDALPFEIGCIIARPFRSFRGTCVNDVIIRQSSYVWGSILVIEPFDVERGYGFLRHRRRIFVAVIDRTRSVADVQFQGIDASPAGRFAPAPVAPTRCFSTFRQYSRSLGGQQSERGTVGHLVTTSAGRTSCV